jgi:hypothetical protein
MLKTLDILIGATTVLLIFALAVTVLTQAVTSLFSRKGAHLQAGLASLLQQLGIGEPEIAGRIAGAVLAHPMLSPGKGLFGGVQLGTVIHREELTKLLLEAASGEQPAMWSSLDDAAKVSLVKMLQANGITEPGAVLKSVRMVAMQLEASNPELATDVRQSMAILQVAASDYVARLNSWFDQTIDRVSQQFAKHTHVVTVCLAAVVVVSVQLDVIAVVDRFSVDDGLRGKIVQRAISDSQRGAVQAGSPAQMSQVDFGTQSYYDALGEAGLISFPLDGRWGQQWSPRKIPGMLLAIMLVSLGAPFWYNVLKNLLGLRSAIAQKDDAQRLIRQTTQEIAPSVSSLSVVATKQP